MFSILLRDNSRIALQNNELCYNVTHLLNLGGIFK